MIYDEPGVHKTSLFFRLMTQVMGCPGGLFIIEIYSHQKQLPAVG
jgi:hypothetical protein